MSTVFPAAIDTNATLPLAVDTLTPIKSTQFNNLQGAVLAIESALGTKPAGIYSTVRARLDALENIVGNLEIIQLDNDLGGLLALPQVVGLRGRPISNVAPSTNQFLGWNGVAWAPLSINNGNFFPGLDLTGTSSQQEVIGIRGISVPIPSVNNTVLTYNSGAYTWSASGGGGISALVGDVLASGTGSVNSTVVNLTGSGGIITFSAMITGNATNNMPLSYGVANIVIPSDANLTLTPAQYINPILRITSTPSLTTTRNIVLPVISGAKFDIYNHTTGGQSLQFIGTTGTGLTVPNGLKCTIYCDGTNYVIADILLGGDLTATSNIAQTVLKINGATVPVSGSLTTGNVLQVSGISALSYGAVNLASSNSVTGTLSVANLPSLSGDVTGAITSNSVVAIQGNTVTAGALTKGQFFVASSTNWSATTLSGDVAESSVTSGLISVTGLQGRSLLSTAPSSGQVIQWGGSSWAPQTLSFAPSTTNIGIFGDGNDGTVTCDGSTAVAGMSRSGSIYTMTRDCYYANLTINVGITVMGGSFRLFVSNTFTNNGHWSVDGLSGTAGGHGGGARESGARLGGGFDGGVAASGDSATNSFGGNGGNDSFGLNGGGVSSPPTANYGNVHDIYTAMTGFLYNGNTNSPVCLFGGSGGGASAGNTGGGGGGVGILLTNILTGSSITANGGAGNSGSGQFSGGGGGGYLVIIARTTSSWAGTITASGGASGGGAASAGTSGTIIQLSA